MRELVAAALAALSVSACDGLPGSGRAKAEAAVRAAMFDPDAAKFRWPQSAASSEGRVCGEVNGKNRMGAYVGFTPFIYDTAMDDALIYNEPPSRISLRMELEGRGYGETRALDELFASCTFVTVWRESCGDPREIGLSGGELCAYLDANDIDGLATAVR